MPTSALEAAIDMLHLDRADEDCLRGHGLLRVGDIVASGSLTTAAWDALGRQSGARVREILAELDGYCDGSAVDWPAYWEARGIRLVPPSVHKEAPTVLDLLDVLPDLLKAALGDNRRAMTDPDRDWIVIDGRNGLVSQERTLEELGAGVLDRTRERVRQIEKNAMRIVNEAWARGFHGVRYRIHPAFEPSLNALRAIAAAVDGVVVEPWLLERLGMPSRPAPRQVRRLPFVLRLAGLKRFDADGAGRPAVWAQVADESVAGRVELADRASRHLTEVDARALSAADIVFALNKQRRAPRVTVPEVDWALPLSPAVERRPDGRWEGRFEYLTRRGDQAYRVIQAAGGPVELADVTRQINALTRTRPVEIRNLSNQLVGDPRFVPIGKSGQWGLADRDADAATSIVELMVETLRRAGHPLDHDSVLRAVQERRVVSEVSVAMYLEMRPEFVRLPGPGKRYALADWPEAKEAQKTEKEPGQAERARTMAIAYLKPRGGEMEVAELAKALGPRLGMSPSHLLASLRRHRSFAFDDSGPAKRVRLVADEAKASRRRRGPTLADRIGDIVIPYLQQAPDGERDLADVAALVKAQIRIVPNNVYNYLRRVPGVVRIDEGERKLVRLVRPPDDKSPETWPAPATEARVRALMRAGEKPNVEFKSTLRWNVKANLDTPDQLNKMVTKTIAAFANTQGGTLLIGVDPSGAVCGIELDCRVIQKPGETAIDAFSQDLATVMKNHLGLEQAAHVATQYAELDDGTVCVVDVLPSDGPVYVQTKGVPEFYVRNGTTSEALSLPSAIEYIKGHWK